MGYGVSSWNSSSVLSKLEVAAGGSPRAWDQLAQDSQRFVASGIKRYVFQTLRIGFNHDNVSPNDLAFMIHPVININWGLGFDGTALLLGLNTFYEIAKI